MHAGQAPENTSKTVKLRLGVGVIVALAALLVLGLIMRSGGTDALLARADTRTGSAWELAYTDTASWEQEGAYLEQENWERLSAETDAELLPAGDIPETPDSIRILVLGDSFIWGTGVLDPDMRWWVKLQDELDTRTSPGTFTVRAIGTPGASTMLQNTWLNSGILTSYNPDVIVIPYVANDFIPHPTDFEPGGACARNCPPLLNHTPEFIDCYKQERSEARCRDKLHDTYPTAATYADIADNPLDGPYSSVFRSAIRSIAATAGDLPLLWMPTPIDPADWDNSQHVKPLFADAGFTTLTPERTLALLQPLPAGSNADPDRHLNPADTHPGPVLTTAYAADTADAILSALPPSQIADAQRAAQANPPQPAELVSWALPTSLEVNSTPTFTEVRIGGSPGAEEANKAQARQSSPCASLKRPHARLTLSRLVPPGSTLTLTLTEGPAEGLDAWAFGYQDDGTTTVTPLGTLNAGAPLDMNTGPQARGILLADRTTTGCSSATSTLPSATVTLQHK